MRLLNDHLYFMFLILWPIDGYYKIYNAVTICAAHWRENVMTRPIRVTFLTYIILLIMFTYFGGHLASGPPSVSAESSTTFFYHNRSLVFRNENDSVFIYENADLEPPSSTEPTTTALRCYVMRQIQYISTTIIGYLGLLQWATPPLSQDYAAVGIATMHVWLSSDDANPQISGYGMAIYDQDENGNILSDVFYNYNYVDGKALSAQPTAYSLTVNVNHVFLKNHRVLFQVLVGSTTQGWRANVYFDSSDRDSGAVVPGNAVVVPEFGKRNLILVATAALTMLLLISKRIVRKRHVARS